VRPRIGLYGGTFDPPHIAHLAVAERAWQTLRLDRLILMPCYQSPLKDAAAASGQQRLEMLRLAVADRPEFEVSDRELRRGGPSYTADTIEALAALYGEAAWWLVLGTDALADFGRWRSPQRILAQCRLAVAERPGDGFEMVLPTLSEACRQQLDPVPIPPLAVSSSNLRADLAAGRSIRYLVTDSVLAYVGNIGSMVVPKRGNHW